jgi:hypothetical protein
MNSATISRLPYVNGVPNTVKRCARNVRPSAGMGTLVALE